MRLNVLIKTEMIDIAMNNYIETFYHKKTKVVFFL